MSMSKFLAPLTRTGVHQPYAGAGAAITRGLSATANSSALSHFVAQNKMNQVVVSPSPLLVPERVQIAAAHKETGRTARALVPQETPSTKPVSTAVAKSDSKPAQIVEPKKSPFQTLTQRKVLIAAGVVLGVAGLAGAAATAYYFYPVATAAHAATVGHAGRAVAMNTHKVLQSGFVNTLLMAHLVMKIAVIPAAQASSIVVLPVIGTAIMGTLGAFVFLYAANQVYKATKGVIWSGLSFVANKFDEQLNQNLLGRGIKQLFGPLVSSAVSYMAEKPVGETTSGVATTAEDSQGTVLGNTVRVGFLGALGVAGFYLYSKSTANA